MRTFKKALVCFLCIAAVAAASVLGTLAYLTDRETAKNTFTVGNVDIKLDETDVDENGKPIEGADRVTENEYHLIPGQTYTKDPTVTVVKGSEESYVRMMVTINCYSQLKAIFGEDFLPQEYVNGTWNSEKWPCVGYTVGTDNTITYEFRYYTTVDASDADADIVLPALFGEFTLPGTVTGEELATISGLTITAEGHAIQAAGFADADAAWAAFDAQYNP